MTDKISPDNRRIGASLLLLTVFVGSAKIIGALKEIGLAARYGTSATLDAYALIFNLFTWPINVFFSAATAVVIPMLVTLSFVPHEQRELFFREALGGTILSGAIVGLVVGIGCFYTISTGALGLTLEVRSIAVGMIMPLALMIPIGIISALLSARMMSARKYINTLFEAIPSIVLLVAILCFPDRGSPPLVWGTVLGFFAYAAALLSVQLGAGAELVPKFSFRSVHWAEIGKNSALMLVGQIIFTVGGAVTDQLLVSHLGRGSNSTLGYAARLLMLINTFGATAVARATLPVFAAARLNVPGADLKLTYTWMPILFGASVLSCLIAVILAPGAIRLLFERGSFTQHDAIAVTSAFRFGLIQIPFYFAGVVIVQLLASRRKYRLFILINTISLAVKLGSAPFLLQHLGIEGLMISNAFMQAVSTTLLLAFLVREGRSDRSARDGIAP